MNQKMKLRKELGKLSKINDNLNNLEVELRESENTLAREVFDNIEYFFN